jgi:hypothetical protein
MSNEDPQNTWSDYYQRKKAQRVGEASQMWKMMQDAGVDDTTVLALDFVLFGTSQPDVQNLAKQLAENYEVQVTQSDEQGYWLVTGTTRPYGISLNQEQHLGWVEFMADVARSHACVFSAWSFEVPSLDARFDSQDFESDG